MTTIGRRFMINKTSVVGLLTCFTFIFHSIFGKIALRIDLPNVLVSSRTTAMGKAYYKPTGDYTQAASNTWCFKDIAIGIGDEPRVKTRRE